MRRRPWVGTRVTRGSALAKSLASLTSRAGRSGSRRLLPRSMACGAAERGPEPSTFQRHPEAGAPRLAHGYRLRSMNELRDQEFSRLAGEGLTR